MVPGLTFRRPKLHVQWAVKRDLGRSKVESPELQDPVQVWTIEAASQGTDSAIAAIEAGECIDTGDDGLGTSNAAISPSWLLSVFSYKCDNSSCLRA